jgi:uncharacterized membrane protein YczE
MTRINENIAWGARDPLMAQFQAKAGPQERTIRTLFALLLCWLA